MPESTSEEQVRLNTRMFSATETKPITDAKNLAYAFDQVYGRVLIELDREKKQKSNSPENGRVKTSEVLYQMFVMAEDGELNDIPGGREVMDFVKRQNHLMDELSYYFTDQETLEAEVGFTERGSEIAASLARFNQELSAGVFNVLQTPPGSEERIMLDELEQIAEFMRIEGRPVGTEFTKMLNGAWAQACLMSLALKEGYKVYVPDFTDPGDLDEVSRWDVGLKADMILVHEGENAIILVDAKGRSFTKDEITGEDMKKTEPTIAKDGYHKGIKNWKSKIGRIVDDLRESGSRVKNPKVRSVTIQMPTNRELYDFQGLLQDKFKEDKVSRALRGFVKN